jgi:hypothetical protein
MYIATVRHNGFCNRKVLIMQRITVLLLAVLMCSTVCLSACYVDAEEVPQQPLQNEFMEDYEPVFVEDLADETLKLTPDIPPLSFDGASFHVLHWDVAGGVGGPWIPWEEIAVLPDSADALEQQVYLRNAYVETMYDVRITSEYAHVDTIPTLILTANRAGDSTYQMMAQRCNNLSSMWLQDVFYDLNGNDLPYIDLSKPWWNPSSVDNFTFGAKTQFAASDMLLLDKGASACVYFNAELAQEHEITDLYDLARHGEWTWERMASYAQDIMSIEPETDDAVPYGVLGSIDLVAFLYTSSGCHMGTIEKGKYFSHQFDQPHSLEVMTDIYDDMYYVDYRSAEHGIEQFKADQGLFMYGMLKSSASLRDMESNYGVLPVPKYSEDQNRYYTLVWQHYDSIIGVPKSCGDTEMVSAIVEALSAESFYTVYPMFYETVLLGSSARDAASKEMLRTIFSTRTYDIGMIYDPTTFAWKLWADVTSETLPAHVAAFQDALDAATEQFNEMVDRWN